MRGEYCEARKLLLDNIVFDVADCLKSIPEVSRVYLFGSLARRIDVHSGSDADLEVVIDNDGLTQENDIDIRGKIREKIHSLLGGSMCDVGIISLNSMKSRNQSYDEYIKNFNRDRTVLLWK